MTKIITRYFESARDANDAVYELIKRQRLSPRIVDLYTSAEGLADKLAAQSVDAKTIAAYEKKLAGGGAVLLVRAGARPLSVAQTTRDVTAQMGAADMGDLVQEVKVKEDERPLLSVLSGQPLMLSRPLGLEKTDYHMADWPIPLISRRKPNKFLAIMPNAPMAGWPIKHLVPGHKYMAKFPFDHLVPHKVRYGGFPIGLLVPGHKYMANFPFGHLVPHDKRYGRFPFGLLVPGHKFMAKFPFGHLVPNHNRMANWPFPNLINGKTGTNALAPHDKRYGRFPFGLLVPGHKFMAKIPFGHLVSHKVRYGKFPFGLLVPGQKFMAKFPFAHIVPGHKHMAKFPFGHIVPGHKYMANFIFPHTKN